MTRLLSGYATPFITGLFIVSLVSGIGLFFHFDPGGFHGMHEWLSMLLILPFGLHVWKNWRPMKAYFRHLPMVLTLAASALAAAIFMLPASGSPTGGGPPQFQLAHLVLQHPVADVAPGLGMTAEELTAAGFSVADPRQALTEIAVASGKTESALVAALIRKDA
jgi:hypothetical protein